jgi:hypothetical protein
VVVGLHGPASFPDDVRGDLHRVAAASSRQVQVVDVPAGVTFGAALGHLTARASGVLVTKVDDDDFYGPDHVEDLVLAHRFSGAHLVGRPKEFVYLADLDQTRRRRGRTECYRGFVCGGTMLLAKGDLEELGGWRPIPRGVDRGLSERVLRSGRLVYRTHGVGYLLNRHGADHTWTSDHSSLLVVQAETWPGLLRHEAFGTGPATAPATGSGGEGAIG